MSVPSAVAREETLAQHDGVTLVWPPSQPGDYTLIVDGRGHPTDGDAALQIVPSRAVLHRKAAPDSAATAADCLHDCVPLDAEV